MEPTTFEAMYEAYAGDVYRFSRYLTGSEDAASEITAETFFRAWAGRGKIRLSTAKSYLLTIARNLALDGFRQTRRWAHPLPETVVSSANADARIELERTLAAISRLEAEYREPLLLTAAGGLSYEETAAILKLPLATVKIRIYRARLKIAGMLGREEVIRHEHSQ